MNISQQDINNIMIGGTLTTSSSSGNSMENITSLSPTNIGLIVETTTWSRDSHELFDYEAHHINNRRFLVSRNSKIFRHNTDCIIVGDDDELPLQGDYLLSIKISGDGKYIAFPADRSLGTNSNGERQLVPKKVWLIVRDLPSKCYTLQQNDLVKLGRFKLRVKQLVRTGEQIPELRLDETEASIIEPNGEESLTMQCRICLTEGEQEDDPLLCPCQCRGSIKFVHLECLRHWINGRLNLANENNSRDTFFFRQLQCELCKSPLPSSASIKGSRVNIVKVPYTKPPFIVLENLYGNAHRGVHVISMAEKKDLKLGRGHESDVRISDVSISRYHATIRYTNENFILEDHGSKFGTLVSIRKAQTIENNRNLSLQVGRTVVNLRLSEEPCSPNNGIKELPVDPPNIPDPNTGTNPEQINRNENYNEVSNHNVNLNDSIITPVNSYVTDSQNPHSEIVQDISSQDRPRNTTFTSIITDNQIESINRLTNRLTDISSIQIQSIQQIDSINFSTSQLSSNTNNYQGVLPHLYARLNGLASNSNEQYEGNSNSANFSIID
ncbi:zinc finger C3HC4 FHA domain-containing protein [Cryptosporidium andersoni]|uniref:Zinc finger C3HC4 FHA domain-containing protein n=1 Tax=Cryptosporidium andersoni TaxID=117008 RepID=A0A1J4MWS7_9CRYT|nr:zinc finger C3HC4 FHA domain-containing protein [Cryptosporidium andersoni]